MLATYIAATIAANAENYSSTSGTIEIGNAVYTTTKSGGKLKWLPYHPQPGNAEPDAMQTRQVAHWSSTKPAKDSRQSAQSAFNDPFGDKKSDIASESAEELGETLTLTTAGPSARTAAPNFPTMAKPTNAKLLPSQEKEIPLQWKVSNSRNPNVSEQTSEQALSSNNLDMSNGCPSVKDLKKISQLSTNIAPSSGDLPPDCPWGGEEFQPRSWVPLTFTWTASGLCHHPLYFEEIQLERYGHALGPWLQPFASGAHFFLTLPILPYKMGLELPDECMYTLGYYRPGSCAPYMIDPLPLSIRAGLFEAGAWVGGVAIIP